MRTLLRFLFAAILGVPLYLLSLILLEVAAGMLGTAYFAGFVPNAWAYICIYLALAAVLPVMALTLLSGYPLVRALDALAQCLLINQMAACALLAALVLGMQGRLPLADIPLLFDQLKPIAIGLLSLSAYGICKIALPWPVQELPRPKSLKVFVFFALCAWCMDFVQYSLYFSLGMLGEGLAFFFNAWLTKALLILVVGWHVWRGARHGRLLFFFVWLHVAVNYVVYFDVYQLPIVHLCIDVRLIAFTIALGALYWPSANHFLLAVPQCSPSSRN